MTMGLGAAFLAEMASVRHAALWREKAGLWHDVASAGPVARYVQGRGREWSAAMTGSYDK